MSYNGHDFEPSRYSLSVGVGPQPWDLGVGEAETPIAPVRSITITPELRAQDEAQRRAREAAVTSDWTVKATLSEDNLRRVRVQVSPGRHMITSATSADTIRRRKPADTLHCIGCGATVWRRTKECRACYTARVAEAKQQRQAEKDQAMQARLAAKPVRQPSDVPQTSTPPRSTMKSFTKFETLTPISEADVPATVTVLGRFSPYLPLYGQLKALAPCEYLPIKVADSKDGSAVCQALRKLAAKENKAVEQRTSQDRLTLYLRIAAKAPETK